jgi:L-threonylcarbamoyladenylate synthase
VAADPSQVIAALRAGEVVVLPMETVYGLAADGSRREAVDRLYRLKGRSHEQPSALVAPSIEALLACVPELAGQAESAVRALLPGPYTLVLPNPARRFPWLTGTRPNAIGIRVPLLQGVARAVLEGAGMIAATSANYPGGPDARCVADIPPALVGQCAAVLDGGRLPGVASTVIDLTGAEPVIVREGAAPAHEALARVRAAWSRC